MNDILLEDFIDFCNDVIDDNQDDFFDGYNMHSTDDYNEIIVSHIDEFIDMYNLVLFIRNRFLY